MDAPDRSFQNCIYLHDDENDIEYIRASLHADLLARYERLREAAGKILDRFVIKTIIARAVVHGDEPTDDELKRSLVEYSATMSLYDFDALKREVEGE